MSDDSSVFVSEIVTEFFFNTCQLRTQREYAVRAALYRGNVANLKPPDDVAANYIPLTTGSVAEFYIEPMMRPINDIDVMYHRNTELAIPRGHPPPTQLPAEFHNYVRVHEIIDSHLPGYAYLELRYLLTECSDDGKYNSVRYEEQPYTKNNVIPIYAYKGLMMEPHGPASCTKVSGIGYQVDAVPCMRCLSWPPQAADWSTRHRNHDWPDSITLDRVLSNGCDVVPVAHRQCRQNGWMGKHQWRLSFSRAEVVLINSWIPKQQIVYHMLRCFVKIEPLGRRCTCEEAILSNYLIKTLMLWACEGKIRSCWTDDVNLVRTCLQLLHNLAIWLTDAQCPHYFIKNCSLVDKSLNPKRAGNKLMLIDEAMLSAWFVNNYIRKCSSFDDLDDLIKLQDAVSKAVLWRLTTTLQDRWCTFYSAEYGVPLIVSNWSLSVQSCICFMNDLSKIDAAFYVYFTANAFLHVAYKIASSGFSDELMDVLATVLGQVIRTRCYSNQHSSLVLLFKATKLMNVIANQSASSVHMIKIELSKACLYRALRCKDSVSDSIYCLANVYIAVLYYTTGQYKTAIHHCTMVTTSQDHSRCSSHVVQGEFIPKIDNSVDNVLGLAVFYQFLRKAAFSQDQTLQDARVFTTEPFAHYLLQASLSVASNVLLKRPQEYSATERQQYRKCVTDAQPLFITDVLLFMCENHLSDNNSRIKLTTHQCQHVGECTRTEHNGNLVQLLRKSAVEHLTTFRQLEAQRFSSVTTKVTTDFEALYAYKRGYYQRCLQLSTENVQMLWYADAVSIVPSYPEFSWLMDDDIVSLMALTLIVYPGCRMPESIDGNFEDKRDNVCISQLTLSLYLMTQCQLKLHHSLSSLKLTFDYLIVAQRRCPDNETLNYLTLKLTERKAASYIAMLLNH